MNLMIQRREERKLDDDKEDLMMIRRREAGKPGGGDKAEELAPGPGLLARRGCGGMTTRAAFGRRGAGGGHIDVRVRDGRPDEAGTAGSRHGGTRIRRRGN